MESKFKFDYDNEYDILYIYNAKRDVEESIEVSEDVVLDLDKDGRINGIEIYYASEFFRIFNHLIDRNYLNNLQDAYWEYKEFRNRWFVVVILKSNNQIIRQPMPPLRKSEYVSSLIAH